MKAAPVLRALQVRGAAQQLVHTGQHYDSAMSDAFFKQLGMPAPDHNLEVGSCSHAQQTALIMQRFEPLLLENRPAMVVVYGDVNSTVACAITATKLGIPVAHVEAGLRSFDRSMPEEINRLLTDQISDLLFTPSPDGDENLIKEGIARENIHLVGNVMIDTLVRLLPEARAAFEALPVEYRSGDYILATFHRPSNVDDERYLRAILDAMAQLVDKYKVIFPVHPRTRARLAAANYQPPSGLHLIDPLGYLEFLGLQEKAKLVLTDSGGVQEETTWLGVPCVTVRPNTERPVTITMGTNRLCATETEAILAAVSAAMTDKRQHSIPPLWDGHAAERIAEILLGNNNPTPGAYINGDPDALIHMDWSHLWSEHGNNDIT